MKVQKHISVGPFAKKGEEIKVGDILEVANEGKKEPSRFDPKKIQDLFMVKLSSGEEKNVSFNQTSMNNLIDAYGDDTIDWIGKKVKVFTMLQKVQNKFQDVYYFFHPDTIFDKALGQFILPGKGITPNADDEEIPIIDPVDTKDIPF